MSFRVVNKDSWNNASAVIKGQPSAFKEEGLTCDCQCYGVDGTTINRTIKCSKSKNCEDCCNRGCNALSRVSMNAIKGSLFSGFGGYSQGFGDLREVDSWLTYSGKKIVYQK